MVWLLFHIFAGAMVVLALQFGVNAWRRLPNNWANLTRQAPFRWASPLLMAFLLDLTVIYISVSALVAVAFVLMELRRRSGIAEEILAQERGFVTIMLGLAPIVMVGLTLASPFITTLLTEQLWLRAMMIGGFLLTILQLVSTFWHAQMLRNQAAAAARDDTPS